MLTRCIFLALRFDLVALFHKVDSTLIQNMTFTLGFFLKFKALAFQYNQFSSLFSLPSSSISFRSFSESYKSKPPLKRLRPISSPEALLCLFFYVFLNRTHPKLQIKIRVYSFLHFAPCHIFLYFNQDF